jgi:glycosyltransferase involved in cell wall biosynthesis
VINVVRVYHSAVVSEWRQRDRLMQRFGVTVRLISPRSWNEGGAEVPLDATADGFVIPTRTVGRHPFMFVYNPLPIWRALRAGPIDILDVHEEPASLAAGEILLLRWLARRRPAVLFYGAENLAKRYPPPFRWIERRALKTAAAVYCCNVEAGGILRDKGFTGVVRTLGLGVDTDVFAPTTNRPARRPFRAGFVGRLDQRKGVAVIIDALAHLPGDIELDIYGTGPDQARLAAQVARLGLGERVHFRGFIDHDRLPEVLRTLHVVCVPSQTTPGWVEQFGRVAVEAMACGLGVIVSTSGALGQVVEAGALIVDESDVAGWAQTIAALANDDEAYRLQCAAARQRAEHYSWKSLAEQHVALYREVLR